MITPRQVDQGALEQLSELARRGEPEASRRLQELLFDVRRGARSVNGAQAHWLAQVAVQLGLMEQVLEWASLALGLDLEPDQRLSAHVLAISALDLQSRLDEALRAVRSVDEPAATSPDARVRLAIAAGQVETRMGLLQEALDRYAQAADWATAVDVDLRASLESARGATLNGLHRNEEAVAAYERALDLARFPETLLNLGNALRDLERYDEAERRYTEALHAAPNDPGIQGAVLSNYARLLAARGQVDKAMRMLKDALDARLTTDPVGAAITAEELAKLYARESDYASAKHWARTAVALRRSTGQPEDEGLTNFARSMSELGRAVGARPDVLATFLLDRLRLAPPGEWPVVLFDASVDVVRIAADQLSSDAAAGSDGDPGRSVEDGWLLALLERILAVGPHLALGEHSERLEDMGRTVSAVLEILSEDDWVRRKRKYEARRELLERPFAVEVMHVMQLHATDLHVDASKVAGLRELAGACAKVGVDVAFAKLDEAYSGELIMRLTNVGTWRESLRLVQAHPELLGTATVHFLEQALVTSGPHERVGIAQHIDVLRRCAVVGPERAFAEASSAGGVPLGTKMVIDALGDVNSLDDEIAEAKALVGVISQAGDPESLALAETALREAEFKLAAFVILGDDTSDPARLEQAAQIAAHAGRPDLAHVALRRLAQAWMRPTDGDRAAAVRAAADAFRRAIRADPSQAVSSTGDLLLGLGHALWELWCMDKGDIHTLLDAKAAFRAALDASPAERVPHRTREAARGLHDAAGAILATSLRRSEAIELRQVKVRACRAAIAATDEILLRARTDDPATELTAALWAYQGAVEELCAIGSYAAALAAAEHGRARGFLAEISRRPTSVGTEESDAVGEAVRRRLQPPPTADELTAFLEDRGSGVVVLAWYTTATACYAFILDGGSRDVRGVVVELGLERLEDFGRLASDSIWQRPSRHDEPLSPAWFTLMDCLVPSPWRELVVAAEEIILVPHGVLASVPLHALPVHWMGDHCLLDGARVKYLPGIAVAHRLGGRPVGGDVALVLAHGDAPGSDAVGTEFEREARSIAALVGSGHVYVGPGATAARLFELGSRSSLIHVAAHGRFDDSDPLGSALFLG